MQLADGTPLWPSEWTAVGTVALAAVTIATIIITIVITTQDRNRADTKLTGERARHDKEIETERARHDKEIGDERARHDKEIEDERRLADDRLREERERMQDAEQRAEASTVLITPFAMPAKQAAKLQAEMAAKLEEEPDHKIEARVGEECPVVIIVNDGRFVITNVHARFVKDSTIYQSALKQHSNVYDSLPKEWLSGLVADPAIGVPPRIGGMQFIGKGMVPADLKGVYAIVRWTDRWGTRWEHRKGDVQPIAEDEPWKP